MQMDVGSLYALAFFIAIEGMILFYLKQDIEILKSNNQTFANSSPEERIELFLYSKKDEETLELEKKTSEANCLQRKIHQTFKRSFTKSSKNFSIRRIYASLV